MSIKILPLSDLHLDEPRHGPIDPETRLPKLVAENVGRFHAAVDHAIKNGFDYFVFNGDYLESKDINSDISRQLRADLDLQVKRLIDAGIFVIINAGQHDYAGRQSRHYYEHIFVYNHGRVFVSEPYSEKITSKTIDLGEKSINVVLVPFLKPSNSAGDMNEAARAQSEEAFEEIKKQAGAFKNGYPTIVCIHGRVTTKGREGELFENGKEWFLKLDWLKTLKGKVTAYILGDLHEHRVLSEDPLAFYTGSLSRVDFAEADHQKGFTTLTIEDGKPTMTFHEHTDLRPWVYLNNVIGPSTKDPMKEIISEIKKRDIKDALVRVNITVSSGKRAMVVADDIREAIKEQHPFHLIEPIAIKTKVAEGGDQKILSLDRDKAMGVVDLVREYFADKPEEVEEYAQRVALLGLSSEEIAERACNAPSDEEAEAAFMVGVGEFKTAELSTILVSGKTEKIRAMAAKMAA